VIKNLQNFQLNCDNAGLPLKVKIARPVDLRECTEYAVTETPENASLPRSCMLNLDNAGVVLGLAMHLKGPLQCFSIAVMLRRTQNVYVSCKNSSTIQVMLDSNRVFLTKTPNLDGLRSFMTVSSFHHANLIAKEASITVNEITLVSVDLVMYLAPLSSIPPG